MDNITDDIVTLYEQAIDHPVEKDDVFHYVYGLLHDPAYRTTYAADLRKMLPRIPTPSTRIRLTCRSGPVPIQPTGRPGGGEDEVEDQGRAHRDRVQPEGHDHRHSRGGGALQLGSRSALGWITDRYQRKVDKAAVIINDPNDWCDEHDDPTYIVALIKRVTTVAVETTKIVDNLAPA